MTGRCLADLAPLPTPVTCPEGNLELTLVGGGGAKRFTEIGDFLYFEFTSLTNCVDLTTGTFNGTVAFEFTGGTGQFEGATGSVEGTVTGTTLFADPAGNTFGTLIFEGMGTVVIPE